MSEEYRLCGLTLWNRVRNEEVRRRAVVERWLSVRVDQCVLMWFEHVESGCGKYGHEGDDL